MRSFELKLEWAKHQSQALKNQTAAWRAANGYGAVFEKHPERPGHIIRLKVGEVPPSIPLIIGDALYALRSALDHLAHDLASSFTNPLPPNVSEISEFPIFGDRAMTSSEKSRKIGAIDPGAQAIIEALQPYARGNAYAQDPLWTLYELARVDRHRFVHLTVAQLGGIGIGGDNLHVEEMEIFGSDPTAGDGTELGYASIRPIDPGKPMHMNFTPEPQVVFKEGILAGEPVLSVLDHISGHIDAEVVTPLKAYLV